MIHETAIIHPDTVLGSDVEIGPFTEIKERVTIGNNVKILGWTVIGGGGMVYPKKGKEPEGEIIIRHGTTIGRFVSVHSGYGPESKTIIGNGCFVMDYVNIPHDAKIGAGVIIGAGAIIGGWTEIGSFSWIGINACIHQRLMIGESVMIGMGSVVVEDIPDFSKAYGNPAKVTGANGIGINRRFKGDYYG